MSNIRDNIREIESGVLRKDTVVNNHVWHFKVKRGTRVEFGFDTKLKTPTVTFEGQPFVCRRIYHKWYISIWGVTIPVTFPNGGECYPFSFFPYGKAAN